MTEASKAEGAESSTGNPARDLLRIIEAWQAAGQGSSAASARDLSGHPAGGPGAATLRSAVMALARIHHALDYLDTFGRISTSIYRNQLDAWAFIVVSYPTGWTASNSNSTAFNPRATDNLETLAGLIDAYAPTLHQGASEHIIAKVTDVRRLLEADEDLPDDLRGYIFRLITEVDTAVRESRIAVFDLDEALIRLKVALYGAAGATGSEEARSKWVSLAENLLWPVAAGLISSGPQLALTAAQIAAMG